MRLRPRLESKKPDDSWHINRPRLPLLHSHFLIVPRLTTISSATSLCNNPRSIRTALMKIPERPPAVTIFGINVATRPRMS